MATPDEFSAQRPEGMYVAGNGRADDTKMHRGDFSAVPDKRAMADSDRLLLVSERVPKGVSEGKRRGPGFGSGDKPHLAGRRE